MNAPYNAGRLFITLGGLLLGVGLGLRPHLIGLSPWPPFLLPALLSLAYGGYLLWRKRHPLS